MTISVRRSQTEYMYGLSPRLSLAAMALVLVAVACNGEPDRRFGDDAPDRDAPPTRTPPPTPTPGFTTTGPRGAPTPTITVTPTPVPTGVSHPVYSCLTDHALSEVPVARAPKPARPTNETRIAIDGNASEWAA
ncbi:MAG: hypothetical protein V3S19_05570, partial [Gemmatimonadales bacterium]